MNRVNDREEDRVATELYFPTPIYIVEKPEYLIRVSAASEESLERVRAEHPPNEIYPCYMSDSLLEDPRVDDFIGYVGETAWGILHDQGYYLDDTEVYFSEMWTQEHHKYSSMEQHAHGYGAQIVGFYFLEVPDEPPLATFYDPRSSKLMADLRERDPREVTVASRMVTFKPKPGMLIFTNAWLAHSFGRNVSNKPFKFVHFNINARAASQNCRVPEVEIV